MSTQDPRHREIKDQVEKIWDKAKDVFSKGRQEVLKVSKIGKLKIDQSTLQRQRQRLLSDLGEKTCQLVKEGRLSAQQLSDDVARLELLSQQIGEIDAQIEKISQQKAVSNQQTDDYK